MGKHYDIKRIETGGLPGQFDGGVDRAFIGLVASISVSSVM
jgi:hypothetical protein